MPSNLQFCVFLKPIVGFDFYESEVSKFRYFRILSELHYEERG
jgi:hypothetical protein